MSRLQTKKFRNFGIRTSHFQVCLSVNLLRGQTPRLGRTSWRWIVVPLGCGRATKKPSKTRFYFPCFIHVFKRVGPKTCIYFYFLCFNSSWDATEFLYIWRMGEVEKNGGIVPLDLWFIPNCCTKSDPCMFPPLWEATIQNTSTILLLVSPLNDCFQKRYCLVLFIYRNITVDYRTLAALFFLWARKIADSSHQRSLSWVIWFLLLGSGENMGELEWREILHERFHNILKDRFHPWNLFSGKVLKYGISLRFEGTPRNRNSDLWMQFGPQKGAFLRVLQKYQTWIVLSYLQLLLTN